MSSNKPQIITISYLFPSDVHPVAGVFIRERVARVAKELPTAVISPQPWSPFDGLIRRFKNPKYRLEPKSRTSVDMGIEVHRPRFFSMPMIGRFLDARMMAAGIRRYLRKTGLASNAKMIDAHFVFPDGAAAQILAKRLGVPYTVTLRGERDTQCEGSPKEAAVRECFAGAAHVVSVSDDLRNFALRLGTDPGKATTIPNGVNLGLFFPEDKAKCRADLSIPDSAKVLIGVGSYSLRKGHHRLIAAMPRILEKCPEAILLLVGGPTSTEDNSEEIRRRIQSLGLAGKVIECGQQPPDRLRFYMSAADLFVLATEHEGRANVMNEAAACGLPIVTSDVGGNAEIVSSKEMGAVVPFWDEEKFVENVVRYLRDPQDKSYRLAYARALTWENTANRVVRLFQETMNINNLVNGE